MQSTKSTALICALILGLGVFGAGYCVGKSLYFSRLANRSVTVKGLAEQDVKSDLAVWEINFRQVGDNLIELNQKLQNDQNIIAEFLKQKGFTPEEIAVQQVKVEDRLSNMYNAPTGTALPRYVVTGGLRIRSTRVALIQQVSQQTGTLLQQGITLAFDSNTVSPNPSFYFTGLDAVRPTMMAAATRSARTVAEQFAKDAGTHLGSIQRASQGQFQVMSSDASVMSADWNSNQSTLGSIDKKVRLVTTIEYRLK